VLPRRFLLLIGFLLVLCAGAITLARHVSERLPYNCVINGEISVQLNRHLEYDVPRIFWSFDSPDGSTALQLFGTTDKKMIRLVDTQTGAATIVQRSVSDAPDPVYWRWSPDSRYVFYRWDDLQRHTHYAISSPNSARSADLNFGSWVDVLEFSADSSYLALRYQHGDTLIFVSTQTHTFTRVTPRATSNYPMRMAWSPTGHRFVYAAGDQLITVDPETGAFQQITYLHPSGVADETLNRYSMRIEWSADERYLAVMYRLESPLMLLRLFAVDGLTLTPVETMVLQVDQDVITSQSDQFAGWSTQGHTFAYVRPSGPDRVFHQYNWEKRLYNLWEYDPAARLHRIAVRDIRSFALNDHTLALVRLIDDHNRVELHRIGGTDPVVVGTYPANDFSAETFDRWNSRCGCWWHVVHEDILICNVPGYPWQMVSVDAGQQITWAWETPPGARKLDVPFGTDYQDNPFTAAVWQQGEHIWVEVVDLHTGSVYPLPESLNPTLPPDVVDMEPLAPLWTVDVFRSPDDQTWLVRLTGNHTGLSLYRLVPADNTWDLIYQSATPRVEWFTVSPDSRRIAFTEQRPGLPAPSLIALEADGSKRWDLGHFPQYQPLTWGQCGGIRAVLAGD